MLNKRQEERWSKLRTLLKNAGMSEAETQPILLLCESEVQLAIAEAMEDKCTTIEDHQVKSVSLAAEAGVIISALSAASSKNKKPEKDFN